jgi:hypothetical protein
MALSYILRTRIRLTQVLDDIKGLSVGPVTLPKLEVKMQGAWSELTYGYGDQEIWRFTSVRTHKQAPGSWRFCRLDVYVHRGAIS